MPYSLMRCSVIPSARKSATTLRKSSVSNVWMRARKALARSTGSTIWASSVTALRAGVVSIMRATRPLVLKGECKEPEFSDPRRGRCKEEAREADRCSLLARFCNWGLREPCPIRKATTRLRIQQAPRIRAPRFIKSRKLHWMMWLALQKAY